MGLTGASKRAVLGVDLGTSAVKCVVVVAGAIVASATAPLQVDRPHPGWSEQDPAAWLDAARLAIGQAVARAGLAADAIVGIGLSGQMHGAVVLGGAQTPLRPAMLWNDNRATAQCAVLGARVPGIGQIAGIGPLPGFTAPKLMWLAVHEPALFARIRAVLLPKDYLALWLTGALSTDRSDAAGTLWLDQAQRAWSADVVAASGIERDWLPPLRDGFELAGTLRAQAAEVLGLRAGVAVYAGGGDAAAGAVALGAVAPGRSMMSLGTSGQLLVAAARHEPRPELYLHSYCHTVPGRWFRMAAMLNGARPLAWFAQVLGCSVPELLAKAAEADRARVPLFLPYLTGERSPHGDPSIRGGFYGLEDATGPGEMARAVMEAVAFSMADALASFGPEVALTAPVPVIGGGSRSDALLQTLADALDLPMGRAAAGAGGAALGAARLAELGAGLCGRDTLEAAPVLEAVFEPRPSDGLHDRLARYRGLYHRLKGL
ncbi:MAG: xylulokinase [Pseudomonadota bacterium]